MKVGSLFSGIGGLDLGLERAGFDVIWQVEVDEWCRRVLARHWPDVPRYGDVREVHGQYAVAESDNTGRRESQYVREQPRGAESGGTSETLAPVDLICGGFPCQPVSHAGRRKGESDSRWLWPEFHRIICEVRPRWVLVENVPGLRSIDSGRAFGGVLRDLAEAGYDAVWFDLSAADVGAPHLRERVFIVAHADEQRHEERGLYGERGQEIPDATGGGGRDKALAHADSGGRDGDGREAQAVTDSDEPQDGILGAGGEVAHAGEGKARGECSSGRDAACGSGGSGDARDWWAVEPDVGRVAHGVPARVDRLRGLGNAVVPQIAEWIGHQIMTVEAAL